MTESFMSKPQTNAPLQQESENKPQSEATATTENNIYLPSLKAMSDHLSALRSGPLLNEAEMKSVRSLVAYVAYDRHVDEKTVNAMSAVRAFKSKTSPRSATATIMKSCSFWSISTSTCS